MTVVWFSPFIRTAPRKKTASQITRHLIQALFALAFTVIVQGEGAYADDTNVPVFILHSYSQEYNWTKGEHTGFVETLGADTTREFTIKTEYLDTKMVNLTADYSEKFAEYIKHKYADYHPRAIYVSDDDALTFARTQLQNIFPDVPVFFSGINNYAVQKEIDPSRITGVFERKDILPMIQLLHQLKPDLRDVTLVGDTSTTYQATKADMLATLKDEPGTHLTFVSEKQIEDIVDALQRQKPQVVMLTTFGELTDRTGAHRTKKQSIDAILHAGNFMVFATEDSDITPGVIGGYVTSSLAQGQFAAQLLIRHLNGQAMAAIPPILNSPDAYIFDDYELVKHHLVLPPEIAAQARHINAPATFYNRNEKLILGLLYGSLITIIAALVVIVRIFYIKHQEAEFSATEIKNKSQALNRANDALSVAIRHEASKREEAEALFAMSPYGNLIVNKNGIIEQANDAAAKLCGYSVENLTGMSVEMLVPSDVRDKHVSFRDGFTRTTPPNPKGINRLLSLQRSDGAIIHAEIGIGVISSPDNDDTRVLVIVNDVRERDEAERVKAASAAKSAFLANMSHEIRTPMNAIIGFTRALRRDSLTPKQMDRLDKIDKSANHLLRLINDILDMSKIEAGKMTLNPENFSLKQLLSGVIGQITHKAEAHGLAIHVNVAPDIPDLLYGDTLRISQCLLNYASNAVKFTDHGSVSINISVADDSKDGTLIRFAIEDTGIGIPAESLDKLFALYEQADKTIASKFGGTGLGLVLNKQLAELMGGTVGVQSVYGKGSCFWFTAKIQRTVNCKTRESLGGELENAHDVIAKNFRQARILVAEDIPLNQEIIADMLDEAGLQAEMADNGEIAIAKARAATYDLILMDMQMPVMDGLAATRALRALPEYATVPIIALTANAFNDDRTACFDAGMNDFLSKPILPELLYETLLKWLRKRVATQQQPAASPAAAPAPAPANGNGNGHDGAAQIQDCLGTNADIDLAKLPQIAAKPARYIGYFKNYAANFQDIIPRFTEQLQSGDREEARRLVHSLKGTSGQLGIVGIQALALTIESAVKDGAQWGDVEEQTKELEQRLGIVCTDISKLSI